MTTGCVSSTLTDFTLHIYENPTIHVEEAPACSADLTTYGLTVSVSNGATLTSDFGTVTDNGDGTITVSGIPAGQDITLTVTDMTSDCDAPLRSDAPLIATARRWKHPKVKVQRFAKTKPSPL